MLYAYLLQMQKSFLFLQTIVLDNNRFWCHVLITTLIESYNFGTALTLNVSYPGLIRKFRISR